VTPPGWEPATNETPRHSVTADADADEFSGARRRAITAPNIDADVGGPAMGYANLPLPAFGIIPVAEDALPQPLPASPVQSPTPARRPGAWYALVGASAGMALLSVALFAAGMFLLPAAAAPRAFGVVAVTTTPAGAAVVFDGVSTVAPGQLVVPLDGAEHAVEVVLAGHKTRVEKVVFAPGSNSATLNVTLDPG
jgi:hypothetical protein